MGTAYKWLKLQSPKDMNGSKGIWLHVIYYLIYIKIMWMIFSWHDTVINQTYILARSILAYRKQASEHKYTKQ